MQGSVIWAPILVLLFVSTSLVMPAVATGNVGNDDAEFGFPSTPCQNIIGASVKAQASLQSNLVYTSGDGQMSLQYNPDLDISKQCQTGPWYGGADWFQTGIIAKRSTNCAVLTIEVYNTFWGSTDWSWYSNNANCTTVNAMFNSGALWYISEHTSACLTNCGSSFEKIDSVSFGVVGGSGGGSYYYTENTPTSWYWLRSSICFCGVTDGGTIYNPTFTTASGTLDYQIGSGIWSGFGIIGPPIDIATAENSNMQYGCMSQPSSGHLTQSFHLTGHC